MSLPNKEIYHPAVHLAFSLLSEQDQEMVKPEDLEQAEEVLEKEGCSIKKLSQYMSSWVYQRWYESGCEDCDKSLHDQANY